MHVVEENILEREYLWKVKSLKNMKEVAENVGPGGVVGMWWSIGETIASVIERDGSESSIGKSYHLVAPGVPYLRETVQEYDGVFT